MKKPLIGVLPLWDEEKGSIWMLPGYMQGIEAAGGIPTMLSLTADEDALVRWAENLDGFLFTGGQDVDPKLYSEEKLPVCGEVCPQRDTIELFLLNRLIELNKPVFGICRGLQFINAALGGTLYQDIPTQMKEPIVHEHNLLKDITWHQVQVKKGSPLYQLAGGDTITVNSYHHQGIKKLASALQTAACSQDGLIEAAFMPGCKSVFAVQWHPELNFKSDQISYGLFKMFIDSAKVL